MNAVSRTKRYRFDEIKEKPDFYARMFSEGNKKLEGLLLKLYEYNVSTRGCCIGNCQRPYICFDNIDVNLEIVCSMINQIYNYKGVIIEAGAVLKDSLSNVGIKSIIFRCDIGNRNQMFDLMKEAVIPTVSGSYNLLPSNIKKLMDICFSSCSYIIPHGGISYNHPELYLLNPITFLAKGYDKVEIECDERLTFIEMLTTLGFLEYDSSWWLNTHDHSKISEALNEISLGIDRVKSVRRCKK